jgi:uncharacterized beta-barrel protein YwiB (DUF1934 family)
MEMPVKVKVKTTIDNKESFELVVFGQFFEKDNASFLKYEEAHEEGTVRTIVKLAGDEALILRGGAVKMRLPFRLNTRLNGSYELPFGVIETTTLARELDFHVDNGKGRIAIVYDFAMQGELAGRYQLEISFQAEQEG